MLKNKEYISKIKPILVNIKNGEIITPVELVQFHRINCALIKSYLKTFKHSLVNIIIKLDYTIDEISETCIKKIYARNEKNQFVVLKNFINYCGERFNQLPDEELFYIFRGYLFKIVDSELAKQYATADPIGAKIHRNIIENLNNSDKLKMIREYRGCVVVLRDAEPEDNLKKYPVEIIESELFKRLDHQKLNTPYLLNILHTVFIENIEYQSSILLINLVQIFKKILSFEIIDEYDDLVVNCDGVTQYDIDQIRKEVELILKQKLAFTYLCHDKLSEKEVKSILNAFNDMFNDWCINFEPGASLYDYLSRYLKIGQNEYENLYRSKMEYLLKMVREEFKNRLMNEV